MGSFRVLSRTIYTRRDGPVPLALGPRSPQYHLQIPCLLALHKFMALGFHLPAFEINQLASNKGPELGAPLPPPGLDLMKD